MPRITEETQPFSILPERSAESERPQRHRQPPSRLQDYEVNLDDSVNEDGELVHFAFFADLEPVTLEEAL